MVGWFYAGVHLYDIAVGINDECITRGELLALVIHYGAVLRRDFRVRIGEQLEVEPFFRAKIFVRLRGIDAYSENHCAGIAVFDDVALKIAGFHGATAGEIFRIEIKNHPFPVIIFQTHLRTVSGAETEIRRRLTDFGLRLRFCCRHGCERRKTHDR